MDIQFAFANPTKKKARKRKKALAKHGKSSKLKAKSRKSTKLKKLGDKSMARKRKSMSRKRKRKNPERIYATKKVGTGKPPHGKTFRDVSRDFPTKHEVEKEFKVAEKLHKKYVDLLTRRAQSTSLPEKSRMLKQAAKIKKAQDVAEKKVMAMAADREAELKTIGRRTESGWKLKLHQIKAGSKPAKVKGEAVAKKKKKRKSKKAKKVAAAKKASAPKKHPKRKRKSRKSAAAKKHPKRKRKSKKSAAAKHPKRKRKSKKHSKAKKHGKSKKRGKRRYAKRITHSHSRKVRHVKKGQTLSGMLYSKGKGRKRLKARVKIKFNPFGGLMKVSVKDLTGYEGYAEPLALLAGGAVYQKINALLQRYVPAQIQAFTMKVPGIGPALLPILAGVGLHMAGKKVPGQAGKYVSMLGEGLIGASIVGAGVSASQMLPFLSTPMSGVQYTPMSGVQYTPMSGVQYTPMSGPPQLGSRADFGRPADYGGGAGYTEQHPFSSADFGADDDSDDSEGDEEVSLGNAPGSQCG